ncbi:MAG: AMP-binding protein [bacterium]|nr:AMP-binding protein [bacterium]
MTKEELLKAKQNLEILKLSGYPSIDKPWVVNYNQKELGKEIPKRTVFEEVYNNNIAFPKDLALEFFGSKIDYKTFFKNIEATAKAFQEYGIKKGNFVTICAAGVPETVYSFYALSKLGAVANMIAPHFEKKDLIARISDCESDVLIIMDEFYPDLKDAIKNSRIKNIIILPTLNSSLLGLVSKSYKLDKHSNELYWNQFIRDGKNREESYTTPYEKDLPLTMVYSSGTTGASKGILLSNDSFQNSIQSYPASGVDISRGQKFYQIIPPWYSTGLSTSIHLPLSYGTSVFMDPRFERDVFVRNIVKVKPNYCVAPTSMYEGFLDEKLVKNKDLSFFNYPFEGGEPLSDEVAIKIENVFKSHGSNASLRVAYGQCECGAAITTQTQMAENTRGSVGIPLPGITIGIFDEDFNELPYYERGQILANTPCSMLGYYKNEKATEEYFHIDKNGTKWNCTGDIGYIDENGNLFVQGRASDYSIINGDKIYNFDIENILMELDSIKICDVLEYDNDGTKELSVHIIFNEEYQKMVEENEDLLKAQLCDIQKYIYDKTNNENMVPCRFKIRNSFPYAKSGKRDVEKMKQEKDGFIVIDKLKKDKQKDLSL